MNKRPPERWVEKGPLAPWMIAYAKWLVSQPGAELTTTGSTGYRSRYPTGEERSRRCTEYAGRQVHRQFVPLLEKRQDFRDYFEKMRGDAAFHAKELARDTVAPAFAARQKGLEKALGKKVDKFGTVTYDDNLVDHREIERYTRPYLDLAFPKKENEQPPIQKFTINLFGAPPEAKQRLLAAAAGEEELDTIDYEVIETEKTETEDE